MRARVYCNKLRDHIGKEVTLYGWVHKLRDMGGLMFIILRDRTGLAQVVVDEDRVSVKPESVVEITGDVQENAKAPNGVELLKRTLNVLSEPKDSLPLSISTDSSQYGLDVLLNNRMFSLRNPKLRSIFEVQSTLLHSFSQYLHDHGFYEIKTSKIINSGTEGGTGLFEVNYFSTKAFLTQSPQFYKQAAVAAGLEKVFEIGAAYRAEKHETNRHLNEYVSLDIEMGFIDSLSSLFSLERELMATLAESLQRECSEQLAVWNAPVVAAEKYQDIPEISYDEAKNLASDVLGRRLLDVDGSAERAISDWAMKEHGVPAAFIYGYPRRKRPFYTMPDNQKTKSFDLIFHGLEITSGGLRIHDYDVLLESAQRFSMDLDSLQDYLSIFQYACPPHGGFAIGLERLTQQFLGMDTVKLASLFPRDRNRVRP